MCYVRSGAQSFALPCVMNTFFPFWNFAQTSRSDWRMCGTNVVRRRTVESRLQFNCVVNLSTTSWISSFHAASSPSSPSSPTHFSRDAQIAFHSVSCRTSTICGIGLVFFTERCYAIKYNLLGVRSATFPTNNNNNNTWFIFNAARNM